MQHFDDAQIEDLKRRTDVRNLAQELRAELRPHKGKRGTMVGSCPVCGGSRNSNRFEATEQGWVCAVCQAGGDAIELIRVVTGCSFAQAVERLGGVAVLSEAEQRRLEAERLDRERQAEAKKEFYRQRELSAAKRIWTHAAVVTDHSKVMRYLASRGLALPNSALIREATDLGYFHGEALGPSGKPEPRCLARGPAMVSAMLDNDGNIQGVHITYLAPDGSTKLKVACPDTGEMLNAKKYRGQKLGVHIVLRQGAVIRRLFLSEGIETGLSVARALHKRGQLKPDDAFWAAGDLGNLGGPHKGNVLHSTKRSAAGRPMRIPGPEPATDGKHPAIAIPDSVHTLVLLGDGDSEVELTTHAMARARARYLKPGRAVAIAMAPKDMDFNDMLGAQCKKEAAA